MVMREIVTRKSRKLLGDVRLIESEFAVFEEQNGETVETHHQRGDFERYDLAVIGRKHGKCSIKGGRRQEVAPRIPSMLVAC